MYYTEMRSDDNNADAYSWQPEDFGDINHGSFVEDDPWLTNILAEESVNISDTLMSESSDSSEFVEVPFVDDESFFDDENDEDGIYGAIDEFVEDEWDEPEPFAEYDGDLKESLYVLDDEISDISRNLRIDEFVAGVESCSDAQREQIVELLESLSVGRMRSWVPWLRGQDWTGHSLLLFLDFRLNYWEENPEWWEYTFWHPKHGHWWTYPSSNYNMLSLDATYMLVHARVSRSSDEIVDEAWLKDWEDFTLWKHGFPSFASFAVFRANLKDGEDWRSIVVSNSEFETEHQSISELYEVSDRGVFEPLMASLDGQYRIWHERSPFQASRSVPKWFAIQDWYDPSEWHDGLDWECGLVDSIQPYMHGQNDLSVPYVNAPYRNGT